jgi:hypothetical protein
MVRYHPEARAELEAAVDWYEDQRPSLGEDMDREIQRAEAAVSDRPNTWAHWPRSRIARRFILSRFPYSLVYRVRKRRSKSSRSPITTVSPAIGSGESLRARPVGIAELGSVQGSAIRPKASAKRVR